jgi:hypothetical protein
VVSAPAALIFFYRAFGDDLVQHGLFAFPSSQDSAKPLDVFSDTTRTGKDNSNIGFRDINAFI